MKRNRIILFLFLSATYCNAQSIVKTVIDNIEVEIYKIYYDNGQLKNEWTESYQLHGYDKEYYISGQIRSHSEYRNGKKWRVDSGWYESGAIKRIILKDSSSEKYTRLVYYEDGKLQSKSMVNEELKDIGEVLSYYSNGQIKQHNFFDENNRPTGKFSSFYENGRKWIEAEYIEGVYTYFNYWKEDGVCVIDSGNGTLTIYDSIDNRLYEDEFRFGLRNGISKSYKNGVLILAGTYVNGNANGPMYRYYPNGKLKEIDYWKDGIMTNSEKYFPMYDNPILIKHISIRPQDRRDTSNKLIIPKIYPELINEKVALESITSDTSIYKNVPQDYVFTQVYRVTLTPAGVVSNFTFSSGDGPRDEIGKCFRLMLFNMKNQTEEGVNNQIWITFTFELKENK